MGESLDTERRFGLKTDLIIKGFITECSVEREMKHSTTLQNARQTEDKLSLYVRMHNGNGCCLLLNSTDTIMLLLDQLKATLTSIPPQFRLLHQGKELVDQGLTLTAAGLRENSILHLEGNTTSSLKELKIDVCVYFRGQNLIIRVKKSETISNLKVKLHRLLRILPKYQRIVFRGEELQDQKTMNEYQIRNGSQLCMASHHLAPDSGEKENLYNGLPLKEELLQSVVSLGQKHTQNRLNLFRSQNLLQQSNDEIPVIEVQIHRKQNNEDLLYLSKEFNFKLFTLPAIELDTKVDLRSTNSKEEMQDIDELINDISVLNKKTTQLSFSERLMII